MKKTIFTLLIFLFSFNLVLASEITGTISTKIESSQDTGDVANVTDEKEEIVEETVQENQYIPGRRQVSVNAIKEKDVLEVKVLGIELHEDGSLLRDGAGRIYVLSGIIKKHILNFEELRKYSGKTIFDVDKVVLDQYEERNYIEGDLIRGKGTEKVFVVKDGRKDHIHSLAELREEYFGQIIFNVSKKELDLY